MEQFALGLAIRALRDSRKLSAKELSINAGLPDYIVSRIENGKARLDFTTALKITSALGVTMDELAIVAKNLTSTGVIEKKEELNEIRAKLKALRSELLAQATSL
jgi:transcriptional regulator with XRE-family HTH domain